MAECPASSIGRGVDEILHVQQKWQENAGAFNFRSQNLLELLSSSQGYASEYKKMRTIYLVILEILSVKSYSAC